LFVKEVLENGRDWKMLSLVLTFAPFFVLMMYAYLGHSTPVYDIGVVDLDEPVAGPAGTTYSASQDLIEALEAVQGPEGESILRVRVIGENEIDPYLESRRADLVLVVPAGFSRAVMDQRAGGSPLPVALRSRGDPSNPDYLMAGVWADMTTVMFVGFASGLESPAVLAPEVVDHATSLSEFELFVPGLLILSLMMLMFTAAAALIREKDKGTLIRLRLSELRTFEWLAAVSATQVLIGLAALGLTYLTAVGVGYRPNGSLGLLFLVGGLTSLSVMALSVLVAAFLRTVFDLVTIGSFPFFILMFFSGGMFPLPGVALFEWGDRTIELNEILPTTHAITAVNRVLSYGAGVTDIVFELGALTALSALFFGVGTWIFARRHLPKVG
jgi:ABC-2 type transport system permease protein